MLNPDFMAMVRGEVRRWARSRILRYLTGRLFLYSVAVGGALLYAMPLFLMISTSLKSGDVLYVRPFRWIPETLHFENYVQAWSAFPFSRYLRNTIYITVFNMVGAVLSTSMAAYALARIRFPARGLFFALLLASLLLPTEVTFVPQYIIWWKLGFVNTYVPLIAPGWLAMGSSKIFMLRQFFRTLPAELEDAAKIDGASPFDCYWRIILPLSKPAIGVVMIFEFIGKWNSFVEPLIYLKDPDTFTLNVGLNMFRDAYYEQFRNMPRMHWFMAIATLIVLPILVIFILLQRHFVEGIQLTGLKG
jgi:ABC-type glycerol-3-phosphate transport system permease component